MVGKTCLPWLGRTDVLGVVTIRSVSRIPTAEYFKLAYVELPAKLRTRNTVPTTATSGATDQAFTKEAPSPKRLDMFSGRGKVKAPRGPGEICASCNQGCYNRGGVHLLLHSLISMRKTCSCQAQVGGSAAPTAYAKYFGPNSRHHSLHHVLLPSQNPF